MKNVQPWITQREGQNDSSEPLQIHSTVTISEQADQECLTHNDAKIVKEIDLEDCTSG